MMFISEEIDIRVLARRCKLQPHEHASLLKRFGFFKIVELAPEVFDVMNSSNKFWASAMAECSPRCWERKMGRMDPAVGGRQRPAEATPQGYRL